MKQQQTLKITFNQTPKITQSNSQHTRQKSNQISSPSEKIEEAQQSLIAQEEVFVYQLLRKQESNRKSTRQPEQPCQNPQSLLSKFNKDQGSSYQPFLLAETLNHKIQIASINQVKMYETQARSKKVSFKHLHRISQPYLKVNESHSAHQNKPLKKSLSSSKLAKEKHSFLNQKEHLDRNSKQSKQSEVRENRISRDIQSIKSHEKDMKKQTSTNKLLVHENANSLQPLTIPFYLENINTTINNLQQLQHLEINSSKSQSQSQSNKRDFHRSTSKKSLKKKQQNGILKQLSSDKYFIDAPLDLNEFQYQLEMEVSLQRNRGFQVYLISPKLKEGQVIFEDATHYKYEIVSLPHNLMRLRVFLLIEIGEENDLREQKEQKNTQSQQNLQQKERKNSFETQKKKQWKIWKEIQLPLISSDKDNQGNKTESQKQSSNKKIKISLTNLDPNCIRVKINSFLDFQVNLMQPEVPISYYCIHQDFNGVEFTKLSLSGREAMKVNQDLLGQGCQGKCQLI